MTVTLNAGGSLRVRVVATDNFNNPAEIEGLAFSANDASKLSVTADAEPNVFAVTSLGPAGTAQVTVTADALIGEGTEEITGVLDVTVLAGKAAKFGFEQLP